MSSSYNNVNNDIVSRDISSEFESKPQSCVCELLYLNCKLSCYITVVSLIEDLRIYDEVLNLHPYHGRCERNV